MYKCPQNHESETADFCSVCGADMTAAGAGPAAPNSPSDAGAPGGRSCPDCGTPSETPNQVFCEVCGHNFQTGSSGVPPVTASMAPPAMAWRPVESLPVAAAPAAPVRFGVTVQVDASLYGVANPDAPVGQPAQVFSIFQSESLVGRPAAGVRAHVPIHNDPGVSRRHAMLLRTPDGGLSVRDLGSANGTQLNGVDLVPGVAMPLKDGDFIALGAWTKIVITAAKTASAVSS